jgi:hypothetical protein
MSEDKISGAPAIHIAPEHQSAPKKNWADIEIEKAAEEIRTGQFTPTLEDDDLITIGIQRGALPASPADIDMNSTAASLMLAQHPRVQDALRRLEQEQRDAKTSQEALEKSQMLFELNEEASKPNQWDGQGRWLGRENEEMRIGLILTPFQFLERLEKVIGVGKVMLNRYAVLKRVALLAPQKSGERPLVLLPGQAEPDEKGLVHVGTLQWPCSSEWMIMKFDEYGVPTTAKYLGWRTALLSMIRANVITEKQAHKAFPLTSGPAANWYRRQLQIFRSQKGLVN